MLIQRNNDKNNMYYLSEPSEFMFFCFNRNANARVLLLSNREEYYKNKKRLEELFTQDDYEDLNEEEKRELQLLLSKCTEKYPVEHVFRIYKNYQALQELEKYITSKNILATIAKSDREWDLNTLLILKHDYTDLSYWIENQDNNPYILEVLRAVSNFHFSRGLFFDSHHVRILYDPINEGYESPFGSEERQYEIMDSFQDLPPELQKMVAKKGIYVFDEEGEYSIDLNIPIRLTLADYEENKPSFCLLFAVKTSQISLLNIDKYLNYQLKNTFDNDFEFFSRFLTLIVRNYRKIYLKKSYSDKTQQVYKIIKKPVAKSIMEWIKIYPTLYEKKNNISENESHREKKYNLDGYKIIIGNLSEKDIMEAFRYLCDHPKNENRKILSEADYLKLKEIGFKLPPEGHSPPFTIVLNQNRDKQIVYNFFQYLWNVHNPVDKRGREIIAVFMKTYFIDFAKPDIDSILARMRNIKDIQELKTIARYFKSE